MTAAGLGWSPNWTRQVLRHTAAVLCLWLDKPLSAVIDDDFDRAVAEAGSINVAASTADRFTKRTAALRQLCFQQGQIDQPPRDPRPPARSAVEHAGDIAQREIRRDVVRYGAHIATTLRPATGFRRVKAIGVLCDWLADNHPDAIRLDQLDRTRHIEPFFGVGPHPAAPGSQRGRQDHHADRVPPRCRRPAGCSSKTSPNGAR